MVHQNIQEAIEELSTKEDVNLNIIQSQFNLSQEDMMAMTSCDTLMKSVTPRPTQYCCTCTQADN